MTDNEDGDSSLLEILLVSKILVSREKRIVPSLFSGGKQFAVSQAIPSQINRNLNNVAREIDSVE